MNLWEHRVIHINNTFILKLGGEHSWHNDELLHLLNTYIIKIIQQLKKHRNNLQKYQYLVNQKVLIS